MAHLHGMIEPGLSRSCGLSAELKDSFLGERQAISRGVDPDGFPPESQCDHCRRAAPDERIEHGSASGACRSDWQLNQGFREHGIVILRRSGVLDLNGPDIRRHATRRSFHEAVLPPDRWRWGFSDRIHVVVCVFALHKVKEQLVGRSQPVLGLVTNMPWLVPNHLASDFPSDFSHRERDAPRDSQPFLPFALVIEIEPVTSCGPCHTVHLSPDGREGFNIFLHGPLASDFVDRVADVPTSAVVRRARDGAIYGIISQGPEHFSGVSKQEPALPAREDGGYHVWRNRGQTHTLFATRETRILPRPTKGMIEQGLCRAATASVARQEVAKGRRLPAFVPERAMRQPYLGSRSLRVDVELPLGH